MFFRYRSWILSLLVFVPLLAACAAPSGKDPVTKTKNGSLTLTPEAATTEPPTLLPVESPPGGAENEFSTDFSKHSVPYAEILSGGPPKDGIPAIDNPKFQSIHDADEWLEDREPVVFLEVAGEARAYPIQILMWHEIVNDNVNGKPLAISFCPLCNTAIAFERTVRGQTLDFGTTGRLRFSNLIMYDRQTETWWQQASGDAIAGEFTGTQLAYYPAAIISWADFLDSSSKCNFAGRKRGKLV
ncbi:MAG: DUF3179 domain-containing (seleno)protein [Chloroflexota bacterium]